MEGEQDVITFFSPWQEQPLDLGDLLQVAPAAASPSRMQPF